ncbi:MAG: hypothetical protein HWE26_04440 [Alteromonadaceae bacterium]|nr:hypothetical protein [Alteromonadaceae bacterium]
MQKYTKWILGTLLVCSGVLATSHTESVTRWTGNDSTTKVHQTANPVISAVITDLENEVKSTHFDSKRTIHRLRFKRIVYYLSEARSFDEKNWEYNRDEALTRASNILRHHQVKTGQGYEL